MPETPRYTLHVKGNVEKATSDTSRVMNTGEAIAQLAKAPPPPMSARRFLRAWWVPLLGCSMSWFLLDIAFYSQNLFQKDGAYTLWTSRRECALLTRAFHWHACSVRRHRLDTQSEQHERAGGDVQDRARAGAHCARLHRAGLLVHRLLRGPPGPQAHPVRRLHAHDHLHGRFVGLVHPAARQPPGGLRHDVRADILLRQLQVSPKWISRPFCAC
jgi:hypothetical protein